MVLCPLSGRIFSLSLVPWSLLVLPRGSEISLVSGTTQPEIRFARFRCAGFVVLH